MAADIGRRYVIIGNGIAGTTCADELRKADPACAIWLITNEPYPLYNRVSLPRYLQGALPEQKVMMRDFAWHEQRDITLLTETLATRVDTDERVVYLNHGGPLRYDALLHRCRKLHLGEARIERAAEGGDDHQTEHGDGDQPA